MIFNTRNLDIVALFKKIKEENFAASAIYLEWNIYRVFLKLGDFIKIQPNFKMDNDGFPLGFAKPGVEDILVIYKNFNLLLEATLTEGRLQLDREGESVTRHLSTSSIGEKKCYTLFVCNKISADFAQYIGFTKLELPVIPITTEQLSLLYLKLENNFSSDFFENILEKFICKEIPYNEPSKWLEKIEQIISEL